MSIIEEQHAAHKARQRRIESAGLRASTAAVKLPPREPCAADELAWAMAVEGCRPDTGALTIKQIRNAVCSHFNVSESDLIGRRRPYQIIIPRHVAYYLCATLTLKSWPEIGRRLGGKDHSTCLYGYKKIKRLMAEDQWLREAVETITASLAAQDVFSKRKRKTALSVRDVLDIRESKAAQSVLALRYGVEVQTIKNVRQRRTWRNVK